MTKHKKIGAKRGILAVLLITTLIFQTLVTPNADEILGLEDGEGILEDILVPDEVVSGLEEDGGGNQDTSVMFEFRDQGEAVLERNQARNLFSLYL